MKILIVDDSMLDRKLIINALKKSNVNHEIIQAVNGEEGLKIIEQEQMNIGLVLLDWQMPKMDGVEFMRRVCVNPQWAAIPIVMVTASGSAENKQFIQGVNPKLAGYVVKPYKVDYLISVIWPLIYGQSKTD